MTEERGAYARNSDPPTSHDAADQVDYTRLERVVLTALSENGNLTSSETAQITGIKDGSITPRFKRLENKGMVVRLSDLYGVPITRKSCYSNRQQQVWALIRSH